MRLYGWVFGAVLGISAVSATFCRVFSGFLAGLGVLFWGFLQFQLLFAGSFPAFGLGWGCCFGDFCSFSYFFSGLFRLLGWVWGAVLGISAVSATFSRLLGWVLGAVLGISAVSATFCEASGIMVEAQQHIEKPLVSFNVLTAKKNTKGVFTSGFS